MRSHSLGCTTTSNIGASWGSPIRTMRAFTAKNESVRRCKLGGHPNDGLGIRSCTVGGHVPLMPVIGALPLSLDNCDGTALQRHRHDVSPKVTDGMLGVYLFQGRIDAQCLGQPAGIACRPRLSVSCLILTTPYVHLCLWVRRNSSVPPLPHARRYERDVEGRVCCDAWPQASVAVGGGEYQSSAEAEQYQAWPAADVHQCVQYRRDGCPSAKS